MSKRFVVIGIPDSDSIVLSDAQLEIVGKCRLFSGGLRHHELVKRFLPEGYRWINITAPVDSALDAYLAAKENLIVIFASGDPLFHGFANTLCNRLPEDEIEVCPYFNSLQLLAHRFLLPYQKMRVVSLVGHPWPALDKALIEGEEMIGILTDRTHQPDTIARRLLEYGYDNYRAYVGEHIGHERLQRFTACSIEDMAKGEYSMPNNLILIKTTNRPRPFGILDETLQSLEGRAGMMTKRPMRLMTLSMLDLRQKKTLWDVGFCTGSVSVEAKLQIPAIHIEAFEKRIESEELIINNCKRFGTPGINYHIGDFLTTETNELPAPDAVFLGGYGGKMKEVLDKIDTYLLPGGCIVFNSVSEKSLSDFHTFTRKLGYKMEEDMLITVNEFNPIHCLKAVKPLSKE